MSRNRIKEDWFEIILIAIIISAFFLMSSCCPKITYSEPTVTHTVDTDSIFIAQPPIMIPPDEFLLGFTIQELCDSSWRVNHPVIKPPHKGRSGTTVSLRTDSIFITSTCDSLLILVDSLRQVNIKETITKDQVRTVFKCESAWHRFYKTWFWVTLILLVLVGFIWNANYRK